MSDAPHLAKCTLQDPTCIIETEQEAGSIASSDWIQVHPDDYEQDLDGFANDGVQSDREPTATFESDLFIGKFNDCSAVIDFVIKESEAAAFYHRVSEQLLKRVRANRRAALQWRRLLHNLGFAKTRKSAGNVLVARLTDEKLDHVRAQELTALGSGFKIPVSAHDPVQTLRDIVSAVDVRSLDRTVVVTGSSIALMRIQPLSTRSSSTSTKPGCIGFNSKAAGPTTAAVCLKRATFTIVAAGNGLLALYNMEQKQFLRLNHCQTYAKSRSYRASPMDVSGCERFLIIPVQASAGTSNVALYCPEHDRFVSVEAKFASAPLGLDTVSEWPSVHSPLLASGLKQHAPNANRLFFHLLQPKSAIFEVL
uniref:Uncharacterized protein n=1 Tax=Chrysotila carterae TaxID=13221 RepID=A0A7S4B3K2_CHRCT